ncbi:MAG: hypothetical protein GY770_23775 [Aestuariibacter sp.]|nr:hypothetical protein [Aestuariibacter sp.]
MMKIDEKTSKNIENHRKSMKKQQKTQNKKQHPKSGAWGGSKQKQHPKNDENR